MTLRRVVVRFHPDEIKRLDAMKAPLRQRSRAALVRVLTMNGLRSMEDAPLAAPRPEAPEAKP